MQHDESAKLYDLLKTFPTGVLVTHSEHGGLRGRPMAIAEVESSCRVWFITAEETAKVHEIEKDTEVLVVCQDGPKAYVSLAGRAHIEKDRGRIERVWQKEFDVWFPEGKADPQIVLIAVEFTDAEYWDNRGVNAVRYFAQAATALAKGERPKVNEGEQHGRVVKLP